MAQSSKVEQIKAVLGDDPNVLILVRNLDKFQAAFCDMLAGGGDFTLRLEVHGAAKKINHCRVYRDETDKMQR